MPRLLRHGSPVGAVFDLLGANENDLTSALGFVLARSPLLLNAVVRRVWPAVGDGGVAEASLALEVRGGGRPDGSRDHGALCAADRGGQARLAVTEPRAAGSVRTEGA